MSLPVRTLAAAAAALTMGAALPASAYDRTITITDAERAINVVTHGGTGINPFVFDFHDATFVPPNGVFTLTVFGRGDFDGIGFDGGITGGDDGFIETFSVGMEGFSIAFNGSSVVGPFAGSRSFSVSTQVQLGAHYFSNGLLGGIFLGMGVDANQASDYLAMRIQYPSPPVPEPGAAALLLLGLPLLGLRARRARRRSV